MRRSVDALLVCVHSRSILGLALAGSAEMCAVARFGDKVQAQGGGVLLQVRRCNAMHALQHTATHCNILYTLQTHCNALQRTATHCNALQRTATHCPYMVQFCTIDLSAVQCVAVHCSALQCVAVCCSVYSTLQCVALVCRTLSSPQHIATTRETRLLNPLTLTET